MATLTLCKSPNVLSMTTLQELRSNLKSLELNPEVDALVITSTAGSNTFCAGLDLQEFHKPDPARLRAYWKEVQESMIELYGTRLATVAKLNGHTVAGGCIVALVADYRVMLAPPEGKAPFRIGLNEAALGMTLPW